MAPDSSPGPSVSRRDKGSFLSEPSLLLQNLAMRSLHLYKAGVRVQFLRCVFQNASHYGLPEIFALGKLSALFRRNQVPSAGIGPHQAF